VKVFVAGATGVLGRRAVPLLVAAGHEVSGIARSPEKADALSAAGATPATVDLFDPAAVAAAVAGHDAVVNIATHIPGVAAAARPGAWSENDRIRTEGSHNLVDAAIAAGAQRYVQESLGFFYRDSGDAWVDEATPLDAPEFVRSFLEAEAQAARAAQAGVAAVVLRFGFFYAADAGHTISQLKAARRGVAAFPGPKNAYQPLVHADDAARAVVAALGAPAGTYNVCESRPLRRSDINAAVAAAVGKRRAWSLPGLAKLGGSKTSYLGRSIRLSSKKFQDTAGWQPQYPSAVEGMREVVGG
jgi:nucleoside-diphosphate-sugar epimerase